jgi:predicted lipoprotein with Yx(FWY)xxD motif
VIVLRSGYVKHMSVQLEDLMQPTHSRRHQPRTIRAARIAAAALIAAGLATTASLTVASASAQSHSVKRVVISTFKSAKVGTILSDGRTLYTLVPSSSACTAACHKIWIPVLLPRGVTKATAGAGVNAAKLGVKAVAGGRQVTYGGKALFWFFEDKAAGQVNGNVTDVWGKWIDVVLVKPASKPTTTTSQPPNATTTLPPTTTTVPGGGGGVGF